MYEYHMDRAVCHVRCEISSVEVTGLACTGDRGALFLRCHVSAGGGRTIQIDRRSHVSAHDNEAASSLTWHDVVSLSCDGPSARVRGLMAADTRSVVFELRRHHRVSRSRAILQLGLGLGRAAALGPSSSELVGRAEVPWNDVVVSSVREEDAAAMERRVVALDVGAVFRGGGASSPAPVMSVRMSVRMSETPATAPQRESACGCECEWSVGGDEDVFGVVACGVADDLGE